MTPLTRCTAWPASLSGLFWICSAVIELTIWSRCAARRARGSPCRARLRRSRRSPRAAPPRSTGRCPERPPSFGHHDVRDHLRAVPDHPRPQRHRTCRYALEEVPPVYRRHRATIRPHDLDGRARDGAPCCPSTTRPTTRPVPCADRRGAETRAQERTTAARTRDRMVMAQGVGGDEVVDVTADRPCSDEGLRFPFRRWHGNATEVSRTGGRRSGTGALPLRYKPECGL